MEVGGLEFVAQLGPAGLDDRLVNGLGAGGKEVGGQVEQGGGADFLRAVAHQAAVEHQIRGVALVLGELGELGVGRALHLHVPDDHVLGAGETVGPVDRLLVLVERQRLVVAQHLACAPPVVAFGRRLDAAQGHGQGRLRRGGEAGLELLAESAPALGRHVTVEPGEGHAGLLQAAAQRLAGLVEGGEHHHLVAGLQGVADEREGGGQPRGPAAAAAGLPHLAVGLGHEVGGVRRRGGLTQGGELHHGVLEPGPGRAGPVAGRQVVGIDLGLLRAHGHRHAAIDLLHDVLADVVLAAAEQIRTEQLVEAVQLADLGRRLGEAFVPLLRLPGLGGGGQVGLGDHELVGEVVLRLVRGGEWPARGAVGMQAGGPGDEPEDVGQAVLDRRAGHHEAVLRAQLADALADERGVALHADALVEHHAGEQVAREIRQRGGVDAAGAGAGGGERGVGHRGVVGLAAVGVLLRFQFRPGEAESVAAGGQPFGGELGEAPVLFLQGQVGEGGIAQVAVDEAERGERGVNLADERALVFRRGGTGLDHGNRPARGRLEFRQRLLRAGAQPFVAGGEAGAAAVIPVHAVRQRQAPLAHELAHPHALEIREGLHAVGADLGVAGEVEAGRQDRLAAGVAPDQGEQVILRGQARGLDPEMFLRLGQDVVVQVARGDDEDGGLGFQAGGPVGVTDLEQGPEEHGPGLAEAGVPAHDEAVHKGSAGEVGFLEGAEFHGWWKQGAGSGERGAG